MSDCWYTPRSISDLVMQVLGAIDLDPCADDRKHIKARLHYTVSDDGLSQQWQGRIFMNPPYSCPGKWVVKLQAEYEAGRVSEAIALVPAATDTNWLSPLLATQPVCFWKGRIKFLDTSYQPKQSARQSHCLVYWGENPQKFKQVFDEVGVVKNVDSWNPAHFGDVPRKADGDQLTIFYEDTHEPPAPDDYPNLLTYEQAWTQWELKNNQPKDRTMTTFQFSATSALAEQIAQLQQQLNQLTASLKPFQECEQKAEDLRRQVAEYGREMTSKGIPQDDVLKWAKSLYSAASGVEFVEGDSGVIAAQNEAIAQLKIELVTIEKREERAINLKNEALMQLADTAKERDEALDKIADMTEDKLRVTRRLQTTQDRHAQVLQELKDLKEQTSVATTTDSTISEQIIDILKLNPKLSGSQIIEALGMDKEERGIYTHLNRLVDKGIVFCDVDPQDARRKLYSLHSENNTQHDTQCVENNTQHDTSFAVGDRACVVDVDEDEDLRYLLGISGTVVGVDGDSIAVFFEKRIEFNEHEVVLRSRYLNLVDTHEAQTKGRDFISNVKTKTGMNNVTWTQISEVCQGNAQILAEIGLCAATKHQKELIEKLPTLLADHISETGDITDMQWLGETFKTKVEALLEAKKSLSHHPGDWVREKETGLVWQVRNFDGEWLSVQQNNKITSLHKSEVELVQQEVAA
ncbi:DNA N-6-adenine-methyltransferase [Nostoc sp. NMS2]|uniref:DNA N-6-adenine-methyltransferase n=1 Tax=Nostoc sp. NMS2 TaxID=2815389 RepID=UPI0025F1D4F6|nr:DNA N-6-adenine-methyltransferase [Nostoc sp. NMS2]